MVYILAILTISSSYCVQLCWFPREFHFRQLVIQDYPHVWIRMWKSNKYRVRALTETLMTPLIFTKFYVKLSTLSDYIRKNWWLLFTNNEVEKDLQTSILTRFQIGDEKFRIVPDFSGILTARKVHLSGKQLLTTG